MASSRLALPALTFLAWACAVPVRALDAAPAATTAPAVPQPLPGIEAVMTAADGWVIKGTYLPAKPGQPTFVLLHGAGMRRVFWRVLAKRLQKAGMGYLAVDLRGHGESAVGLDGKPISWRKFKVTKTENDFANMSLDIQAAVADLASQGVPEESVGFIGTDVGGSLALKYAAVHPKTPLLVLLSPGMNYQEILTVNAMRAYRERPILMIYSELERNSARATPLLYEIAKRSAGERNATLVSVPHRRGVKLVNGPMAGAIVAWIRNPVKPEAVATSTAAAVSTGAVSGVFSALAVSTATPDEDETPAESEGGQ